MCPPFLVGKICHAVLIQFFFAYFCYGNINVPNCKKYWSHWIIKWASKRHSFKELKNLLHKNFDGVKWFIELKYQPRQNIDHVKTNHAKTSAASKHRLNRNIDCVKISTVPKHRTYQKIDCAETSTTPKHRPHWNINYNETLTTQKHRLYRISLAERAS